MIKPAIVLIYFLAVPVIVCATQPGDPTKSHLQEKVIRESIDPQIIIDSYNNAECCLFIDQLETIELERRKSIELDLYKSTHLLQLSTGPTFAALISIPSSKSKERYTIETDIIHVDDDLYVYFPYVALLNKKLELLGTSDFTLSNYYSKDLFQPTGQLSFGFIVDPNNDESSTDAVRYLLIYTRKKHFTEKDIQELETDTREIELKEVSIVYTGSKGEYIIRDTMHGLPGGRIIVSNRSRYF